MKKLWLTYAWKDNEDKDIDYIIQELDKTDLDVKTDKRNLIPGQRLWTQIGGIITDPEQCDAWGIILTPNSIKSQPCIEELSYALDRVLNFDDGFPVFALLHKMDAKEMPVALRIRLCIPLEFPNWTEQVVAAANKKPVGFDPRDIEHFVVKEHETAQGYFVEMRPRFERISPFMILVDIAEKESGNVTGFSVAPANRPTKSHVMRMVRNGTTTLPDGTDVYYFQADDEANATTSYYLHANQRVKRVWFGHPQNLQEANFKSY